MHDHSHTWHGCSVKPTGGDNRTHGLADSWWIKARALQAKRIGTSSRSHSKRWWCIRPKGPRGHHDPMIVMAPQQQKHADAVPATGPTRAGADDCSSTAIGAYHGTAESQYLVGVGMSCKHNLLPPDMRSQRGRLVGQCRDDIESRHMQFVRKGQRDPVGANQLALHWRTDDPRMFGEQPMLQRLACQSRWP